MVVSKLSASTYVVTVACFTLILARSKSVQMRHAGYVLSDITRYTARKYAPSQDRAMSIAEKDWPELVFLRKQCISYESCDV